MKRIWIGVSLAMLVPTVVLVTQVVPQAGRAADLKKEVRTLSVLLEAARPGTPSRGDIGSWQRYGGDLSRAHREIAAFYAGRDRHFERWFPGLAIGPNGAPSRDARQRIADLALRGGVRISRIVDFRFLRRLHDRSGEKPPVGGWSQETDLPNGLGRTFTFDAVLQLPSTEVPRAIRELLNPGSDLLTVVGAHVTIGEAATPIVIPYEKGKDEEFERLFREARKAHPPRDVLLTLTCRILDLDLR